MLAMGKAIKESAFLIHRLIIRSIYGLQILSFLLVCYKAE